MKSIKHCSGRLKKQLEKAGYAQGQFLTRGTDGHAVWMRAAGTFFKKLVRVRLRWWSKPGEQLTLRTAAIRAGLLKRSYCR